jgi:hypothetical protein
LTESPRYLRPSPTKFASLRAWDILLGHVCSSLREPRFSILDRARFVYLRVNGRELNSKSASTDR